MTHSKQQFAFEISLSVLNHLGRQLYRSFATVLGEGEPAHRSRCSRCMVWPCCEGGR